FPLPSGAISNPFRITTGPDGNLWFTERDAGQIGQITTAGVLHEFPLSGGGKSPEGITTHPDGNLWFTEAGADQIGRIPPSTTAITEYGTGITPGAAPHAIVTQANSLWFTEKAASNIGRLSPDRSSTTVITSASPSAFGDPVTFTATVAGS